MKNIIVANWKCNPETLKQAGDLFNSVKKALLRQGLRTGEGIKGAKEVEVVICPPFIYLSKFKSNPTGSPLRVQQNSKLKIGGQDCFWEGKGAFTGEISPSMLKGVGCKYVIIGHSERRTYFKETDDAINKKVKKAVETGLVSILCVGETGQERKNNETEFVLRKQITLGLEGVSEKNISKIVIAYEPVWAIGTGISCDTNEAKKAFLFIKSVISDLYNKKIADNIAILYGGSVSKENSRDYIIKSGMNGLLVGGASLGPDEFIDIVKSVG